MSHLINHLWFDSTTCSSYPQLINNPAVTLLTIRSLLLLWLNDEWCIVEANGAKCGTPLNHDNVE